MLNFNGRHKSANTPPLFKMPFLDHMRRNPLLWSLGQITALLSAIIAAFLFIGSPALLVTYDWNGRDAAPIYYRCDYLNLMSGWETYIPRHLDDDCPPLRFFPVSVSDLFSLFS